MEVASTPAVDDPVMRLVAATARGSFWAIRSAKRFAVG